MSKIIISVFNFSVFKVIVTNSRLNLVCFSKLAIFLKIKKTTLISNFNKNSLPSLFKLRFAINAQISSLNCFLGKKEYNLIVKLTHRGVLGAKIIEQVKLTDNFMTLTQLLKEAGIVGSGGQVKWYLQETPVKLNGVTENRRGKKLYPNDVVELASGEVYQIVQA